MSDFDEIFTEALDGCYLKLDQTKLFQTKFKSSLQGVLQFIQLTI